MRGLRIGFILAVIPLTGCDHHKSANQAQTEADRAAVAQDSDLTGQPPPAQISSDKPSPRATPVTSLSEASPAVGAPPSENESGKPEASSGNTAETPGMAASAPPSDATSQPSAASAPTPSTESAPVTVTPPPSDSPMPGNETAQEQVVVLDTSMGRIIIQLDNFAAPKTCENFRKLVSDGFYNHTVFHRVIPNFVIQGGDPNSKSGDRATYGQGGPGYTLPPEISLKHDRGAVAMARLPDSVNPQRESNGSQFYICVAPCPSLDEHYTVFGHVIKGMDVAARIAGQSRDKRDDPLNRIEMTASLEPKGKALEDGSTVNP